ncbi:MAG: methionyl-tRNA formyltransferase [Thermoguttaceae bacterium]
MKIIVMGTGGFAAPAFRRLLETEHEIVALVTMPLRTQRGERSLLRDVADEYNVPLLQPDNINQSECRDLLHLLAADLFFVCDYGRILSPAILKTARMGGINLHGSLLPQYRGAAPINRALLDGMTYTGVSLIHMIPAVDAGPVVAKSPKIPITPDDTAMTVEHKLAEIGADLLLETLQQMETGRLPAIPQNVNEISKAPKLRKEEALLDWNQPAERIFNHVRAMIVWPRSLTFWTRSSDQKSFRLILNSVAIIPRKTVALTPGLSVKPGTIVKADNNTFLVATKTDYIRILEIQPAGKASMTATGFVNGYKIQPGERFETVQQ